MTTPAALTDLKQRIDACIQKCHGVMYDGIPDFPPYHNGEDTIVNAARALSRLIEKMPEEMRDHYIDTITEQAKAKAHNALRTKIIGIITESMEE